jgi:hypothetical protein
MGLLSGRFFLLLLLALEWAADPHQGRSLLPRPMSSQDVVSASAAYQIEIHQRIEAPRRDDTPLSVSSVSPSPARGVQQRPERNPVVLPGADLVFVLMSLQR